MMNKPACSVVIPAYNSEKYIAFTLRSVLAQTERNIEVIVVDDASSDRTIEIVKEFMKDDDRLILVPSEKNCGVAEARNKGVRLARADLIAFLDSDDAWRPTKVEKQLVLQTQSNADIVYTGASCIDAEGQSLEREFKVPLQVSKRDLLRGNDIICSSAMVKKEYLSKYPMRHSHLHEDYICWASILGEEGTSAAGVQEPLVIYRIMQNSKSGNKLKSARMQWQTYKEIGIRPVARAFLMFRYATHGIKRYFLK